jgi:hypothetical protein
VPRYGARYPRAQLLPPDFRRCHPGIPPDRTIDSLNGFTLGSSPAQDYSCRTVERSWRTCGGALPGTGSPLPPPACRPAIAGRCAAGKADAAYPPYREKSSSGRIRRFLARGDKSLYEISGNYFAIVEPGCGVRSGCKPGAEFRYSGFDSRLRCRVACPVRRRWRQLPAIATAENVEQTSYRHRSSWCTPVLAVVVVTANGRSRSGGCAHSARADAACRKSATNGKRISVARQRFSVIRVTKPHSV